MMQNALAISVHTPKKDSWLLRALEFLIELIYTENTSNMGLNIYMHTMPLQSLHNLGYHINNEDNVEHLIFLFLFLKK
jgi:hypothetical protein